MTDRALARDLVRFDSLLPAGHPPPVPPGTFRLPPTPCVARLLMPKTAGGRQGVAGQPAAGRARLAPLPAVTDPASGRGARIGKISLARPPAPRTPLWR